MEWCYRVLKPFFYPLFDEAKGYVVSLEFIMEAEALQVLPPFTSLVVKHAVYTLDCLSMVKGLYESRRSYRPVTIEPLRTLNGRYLFKRFGRSGLLVARQGEVYTARISLFTREDPWKYAVGCDTRMKEPYDKLRLMLREVQVEELSSLSAGIEFRKPFTIHIRTPMLLSVKLMAPYSLRQLSVIRRAPNNYRLLPTPGYIAASLLKTWMGLVLEREVDTSLEPYALGRITDPLASEMNVRIRPITVSIGKTSRGTPRKVRGVTGDITLVVYSRRLALTLDKLLALASRLGTGKNRSVGFGLIEVSHPAEGGEY
jgi:CRISPR-associated endoribonuclease Cas6